MRNTGGEGFLPALGSGDIQDGADDAYVGDNHDGEGNQQDKQGQDEIYCFSYCHVSTRHVQQGADVTEEVVDDVGATKRQLRDENYFQHGDRKSVV